MIPANMLPERIASKIEVCAETGCWLWTAATAGDRGGYGQVWWQGSMRFAHRVVYELVHGPIPDLAAYHGMCICHRCDVPACVNPEHLFLGTQADNMRDCSAKKRSNHAGARNGRAKLDEVQVRQVRAARGRERQIDTAARFGISQSQVSRIQLHHWPEVS